MAAKLSQELTYDAPLAEVAAMLADPAPRELVCDAQRAVRRTVSVTPAGGAGAGMTVVVDQVQAAQGIPGFAKKFVGDEINFVQTERWSGPTEATIAMAIPGKPGQISGTLRLVESGGRTTESVAMEIKVGIPLVGGKIESLIADLLRRALRAENAVGVRYLEG